MPIVLPPSRWLGVAINDYPGAPLQGCLADRLTMKTDFSGIFNRSGWQWRSAINATATKKNILEGLKWLGAGAVKGQPLAATFSGHGTPQMKNGVLQTVFCPVDFDWSEEHSLFAHEVLEVIGNYPPGVNLLIVWDSCYSEWDADDGMRGFSNGLEADGTHRIVQPRLYPLANQPDVYEEHVKAVRAADPLADAIRSGAVPCCYIPACLTKGLHSKDGETAADVRTNGQAYGAHTHYLSEIWNKEAKASLKTVLEPVVNEQRALLDGLQYQQHSFAQGSQKGMTLEEMFAL